MVTALMFETMSVAVCEPVKKTFVTPCAAGTVSRQPHKAARFIKRIFVFISGAFMADVTGCILLNGFGKFQGTNFQLMANWFKEPSSENTAPISGGFRQARTRCRDTKSHTHRAGEFRSEAASNAGKQVARRRPAADDLGWKRGNLRAETAGRVR